MKKNKMMRLASGLLVATLLTTSVISGTFAKYVTSADANDSARVAKWGVEVSATGELFSETYLETSNIPGTGTVSVDSFDSTDKLVAPGTKNEDGINFTITGQPEVDVAVAIEVSADADDVYLKAADDKYPNMTTEADDKFNLADDYYPVKYKLVKVGEATPIIADATLAQLAGALEGLSNTHIDAGTNLGTTYGTYKITWNWEFNGNNAADTLLGNLAVSADPLDVEGVTLAEGTDYDLQTGLRIDISVTQID